MAACMALSGLDGQEALQLLAHLSALRCPADKNLKIGVGGRLPWANIITRKELMTRRGARRGCGYILAPYALVGLLVGLFVGFFILILYLFYLGILTSSIIHCWKWCP
jgi:cytochrome c biogenesis protein ResB